MADSDLFLNDDKTLTLQGDYVWVVPTSGDRTQPVVVVGTLTIADRLLVRPPVWPPPEHKIDKGDVHDHGVRSKALDEALEHKTATMAATREQLARMVPEEGPVDVYAMLVLLRRIVLGTGG